jgi:nucleotide-binding universal stress UspA family protein
MTYASIMVYTEGDEVSDHRTRIARSLADQFNATLIGIAAGAPRPPVVVPNLIGSEIAAEIAAISAELAEKESKFLKGACRGDGQTEWRGVHGLPNDAVAGEARAADLLVIGREPSSGDPFLSLNPGTVLLRTGRPVLTVPRSVHDFWANKVLIAWQDSREARRAVRDSLPFLARADEILLTQVYEQGESELARASVREVARYLSRHRIGASAEIVLRTARSVTDELLRIAALEKVDLIVCGAYGHSRLGEWVFGGVTRDLLNRCPVCCLFSH